MLLFTCCTLLTFVASVLLGVAIGFTARQSVVAAALLSSLFATVLGVLESSQAVHRPDAHVSYGLLAISVGLVFWSTSALVTLPKLESAVAALVAAGAALGVQLALHNPWSRFGVCFKEETPGATGRFRSFTPVRCSDHAEILGEAMGADHAILRFTDIDHDGRQELTVQESELACAFETSYCPETQTLRTYKVLEAPLRVESVGEQGGKNPLWP